MLKKRFFFSESQGITGERFADTVSRLGFENVQSQLLGDALLERKTGKYSSGKALKGGATC